MTNCEKFSKAVISMITGFCQSVQGHWDLSIRNVMMFVKLTSEEKSQLEQMLSKGRVAAHKQHYGRILLLADQGGLMARQKDERYGNSTGSQLRPDNYKNVSRLSSIFDSTPLSS